MKSDRELHEEICFFVAGGQGTLQTALAWYTGSGRADCPFLKMLEPLPATMPDRAIESAPSSRVIEGGSSAATGPSERQPHVDRRAAEKCRVCNKPKSSHHNGRFCREKKEPLKKEPSPRKEKFDKDRHRRPRRDQVPDGDRRRGGQLPPHMAKAVPVSKMDGKVFCWDYHNERKGCTTAACGRSHRCPFDMGGGKPCDSREHRLSGHQ